MIGFESKPITLKRLQAVLATHLAGRVIAEAPAEVPGAEPEAEPMDEKRRNELVDILGEEAFQELVDTFFEDTVEIMENLSKALASGDAILIDRALHTLKGAAVNVGFNDIAAMANGMRKDIPTPAAVETLNMKINAHKRLLAA